MDATAALESIAGLLASLPDESVEDLLVTFDSLVGVSDAETRPGATLMLRRIATSSQNPTRRDRLLRAAAAVETGQPCALTPEGLSAQQAAAAQSATQEQWEDLQAKTPLASPPGEVVDAGDEDDEDPDESPYMEEEPPKLPHLPVRHFFSGLVVRVGRDFGDVTGRAVCSGDLLKVLACNPNDDGYGLMFLERNVILSKKTPGHDSIIENAGNAWFQPVPMAECIEDLLDAIDVAMNEAESNEDSEDDEWIEGKEAIREDVEECKGWLSLPGERGPAPRSRNGRLVGKLFGRDHELAAWIPLLFACVALGDRFRPDSAPYEMEERHPMRVTSASPGPAYQKFLSSMEISYSDWRDGDGYDLEALRNITKAERIAAVEMLSERLAATPNWRDIEALGLIDTPAARAAIRKAMEKADSETRLRAAEQLTDLGEPVDLDDVIIEVLRTSDLSNGLSQAIDLAKEHPSPRIQEALLDLALEGNYEQRIHCAALALYLGGKADEAFDWNHRPFFLRFGEEDRHTQIEAYKELCARLGVTPKVQ